MPKNKPLLKDVLAGNVTAVMTDRGLTQTKVADNAKKLGHEINQRTVGRVANGSYPATVQTLDAVARGLGVEAWQLLIPSLNPKALPTSAEALPQASPQDRQQIERARIVYEELTNTQRDMFLGDVVRDLITRPHFPVEQMRGNWTGPHASEPPPDQYGKPKK